MCSILQAILGRPSEAGEAEPFCQETLRAIGLRREMGWVFARIPREIVPFFIVDLLWHAIQEFNGLPGSLSVPPFWGGDTENGADPVNWDGPASRFQIRWSQPGLFGVARPRASGASGDGRGGLPERLAQRLLAGFQLEGHGASVALADFSRELRLTVVLGWNKILVVR